MIRRTAYLCLVLTLSFSCSHPPPSGVEILFDFESDEEWDQLHWRCHTLLSSSNSHATHGEKALHLELFPARYSGFSPPIPQSDWRGFSAFAFDAFNPMEADLELVVRIDDRENGPGYRDRVNRRFTLTPGRNTVIIPLERLQVSGKHRNLDRGSIQSMVIFMVDLERRVDLYLDHGRLLPVSRSAP